MPPIERTASSQTFGHSRTHLMAPDRSPDRPRIQTPVNEFRPTLLRSQTPTPPEDQQETIRQFSRGMFADPAPQKTWGFGPKAFTDGHQRLIFMLREECARLYTFNQSLKARIGQIDRQNKVLSESVAEMRSTLQLSREKLAQVTADYREQQDIVREMDADLERTRNKRLSRAMPSHADGDVVFMGDHAR